MAVDFKKLLQKPLDDVKRPPAFPAGTYFGVITKFEFRESDFVNQNTGEKDAQVRFHVKVTRAGDDVLANHAEEIQSIGDLSKRPMRRDMPLSGGNEWVTKTFLDSLGIATSGRTFDVTIPEAVNHEVMLEVTQRPDKNNPENVFNDVRTMKGAV